MLEVASDRAQVLWQNLILIAYASTIAAIPMGDALLFSFTTKKPLAVGIARAVFVSSLGATLTMVITFSIWLTLESIYPKLHIDHFFYQLIENWLKNRSFFRIIISFIFIEASLMFNSVLLGGFLASITPFVGEQNQNKTKFSFGSLMMDLPLGFGTISFIQALTWCLIKYLDRFKPIKISSSFDQQERFSTINPTNTTLKSNRRVTFKSQTDSELNSNRFSDSILNSNRLSNESKSSSTLPILLNSNQLQNSQSHSNLPYSSSSTTNLLPTQPPNILTSINKSKNLEKSPSNLNKNSLQSSCLDSNLNHLTSSNPSKINSKNFNSTFKSNLNNPNSLNSIQSKISKPPPIILKNSNSSNKLGSGTLGRYAWLKSPNQLKSDHSNSIKDNSRNCSLPYSRFPGLSKSSKSFGTSPYDRVSLYTSNNHQKNPSSLDSQDFTTIENPKIENFNHINSQSKLNQNFRKSSPPETIINIKPSQDNRNKLKRGTSQREINESDDDSDDWAETKSQLTEEGQTTKTNLFGWGYH